MSSIKKQKLKALLFDFGGTLAFLDFELLAREFSREGRKLDALARACGIRRARGDRSSSDERGE